MSLAMNTKPQLTPEQDAALTEEVGALRRELARLNSHRFIKLHNSLPKLLYFQFMRGLALGLGTVVGASVLVSFVVYMLSTIDFVPILGDWAADVAKQIQAEVGARQTGEDGAPAPSGGAEPAPQTTETPAPEQ